MSEEQLAYSQKTKKRDLVYIAGGSEEFNSRTISQKIY